MDITTTNTKQVVNITDQVQDYIENIGLQNGLCNIFVLHTTAAVATVDLDPGTDLDYLNALYKIAPNLDYNHPHNPKHFPDHLLATLVGASLTVPVKQGRLMLGTWQEIVLFEFDGPRTREIVITTVKEYE